MLNYSYDLESDVLYLNIGDPQEATCLTDATDTLILRYSIKTNIPCGITILDYKKYYNDKIKELIDIISDSLGIEYKEVTDIIEEINESN